MIRFFAFIFALALLASGASAFSPEHTTKIVQLLEKGEADCARLEPVYQFDCFRKSYSDAIRETRAYRDYSNAGKALRGVEKTLSAIVKQNRDTTKPKIKLGGQRYTAVRPEAVAAGAKAFHAARNEAATMLLRATGRSKVHYTRIAEALNSNKVLIRSLNEFGIGQSIRTASLVLVASAHFLRS
ncbi:hypothetical protein [Phaeobacter sp. HF9A]|uniref:hypothetical protein n=1 Tax=Phaeobacter sp. HF9A TaxID=2721561 RepID=UPI00142FC97D|nr:hypothetical protein [Phaeobacter sp. HF9A]NIZ15261.1 hypothetical protein [Phaeobacter sp. HF9A]